MTIVTEVILIIVTMGLLQAHLVIPPTGSDGFRRTHALGALRRSPIHLIKLISLILIQYFNLKNTLLKYIFLNITGKYDRQISYKL